MEDLDPLRIDRISINIISGICLDWKFTICFLLNVVNVGSSCNFYVCLCLSSSLDNTWYLFLLCIFFVLDLESLHLDKNGVVEILFPNSLLDIGPFWEWSKVLYMQKKKHVWPLFLLDSGPSFQCTQRILDLYPYYDFGPHINKPSLCYILEYCGTL